jgi:hypothetical protein
VNPINSKKIPKRGRRIGKGEMIIIWNPFHIGARILETILTIAILMGTLRKCFGNYIQSSTQITERNVQGKIIF